MVHSAAETPSIYLYLLYHAAASYSLSVKVLLLWSLLVITAELVPLWSDVMLKHTQMYRKVKIEGRKKKVEFFLL